MRRNHSAVNDKEQLRPSKRNLTNFLAEVRGSYDSLPRKLRKLAAFSFDHPDNMALDSITELARRMDSHPSALVRYAQHFGFSGFSELQGLYREHIRNNPLGYGLRPDNSDHAGTTDMLNAINRSATRSTMNLEETVGGKTLTEAIELIAKARTIWLVGAGRTMAVQSYFNYLFTGLGMVNHSVGQNLDQIDRYVRLMATDDVVIATSFHPYTQATVKTVAKACKEGIPCICLTDTNVGPVHGAVNLIYSEDQFSGFRSISATMNLALFLAIQAGKLRRENTPAKRRK